MLQLREINDVAQSFSARVLIELKIPGGAKDADLVRKKEGSETEYLDVVPKDTLRPSAVWYAKQFDIANAITLTVLDLKIIEAKEDLVIFYRIEGTFLHNIDLKDLPYDVQSLKLSFVINCAATGAFPVEIISPPVRPTFLITDQAFALGSTWNLDKVLGWDIAQYFYEEGAAAKPFCAIFITVNVSRRPLFYLTNIVLPMFCAAPLAALAFGIPRDAHSVTGRLECSLTVLLSTTAYKYAISLVIPKVAYLTLLDRYVLGCMFFVTLVCIDSVHPLQFTDSWGLPFDLSEALISLLWLVHTVMMLIEARAASERQDMTVRIRASGGDDEKTKLMV